VHICLLLGYVSIAVHINECIFLNVLLDLVCSAAIWRLAQRVKDMSEHHVVIFVLILILYVAHMQTTLSVLCYTND